MHAVHRLYQYRKSLSTTSYKSRGHKVDRCELCRLAQVHCLCEFRRALTSNASFLLLMYDTEVLKPSNTGKLIADLIPDTHAFLWSRTEENQALLDLLSDEKYQPYVVFPEEYANSEQTVYQQAIPKLSGKRPLFILLDGSWREAKKMFRKSPYLARLPVLSIDPQRLISQEYLSKYQIRSSVKDNQLATAEVAAQVLALLGETENAAILDTWFDSYNYQYQRSVCQTNTGDATALARYQVLIKEK